MSAAPELSRRVPADRLDQTIVVEATPGECVAVAERLGLVNITAIRCQWTLRAGQSGMVQASGRLEAAFTQACVVTLDPFPATVAEDFEVHFILQGFESEDDDPDAPDEVVYDGAAIDLGEATVEQLALALDPYPRKPDAILPALEDDGRGAAFAMLAKLHRLD